MLLAENVFRKAVSVRNDFVANAAAPRSVEAERLREAIEEWTKTRYANAKPEKQVGFLIEVFEADRVLRAELAEALEWKQDANTSNVLFLLVVDAIQEERDERLGEIFDRICGRYARWEKWKERKKSNKFGDLQTQLDQDEELRKKVAWELGEYPGMRRIGELAEAVCNSLPDVVAGQFTRAVGAAPFEVLKAHLLNWTAFEAGWPSREPTTEETEKNPNAKSEWEQKTRRARFQESHLKAILHADYTFRQDVANAVGQPNTEAEELALLAVEMWRAISPNNLIGLRQGRTRIFETKERENKSSKIPAELLKQEKKLSDDDGWDAVEKSLAVDFAKYPQKAVDLWEVMEWPYPFALVLREELRQIQKRWEIYASKRESGAADAKDPEVAGNADEGGIGPAKVPWKPGKRPKVPTASAACDASDLAVQMKLFGLAFSGGGIRSATFNMGVLQKLSHFGLLSEVDYLSTVSGGGYIGSWLTGWMRKNPNTDPAKFHEGTKCLLSPEIPDPRVDSQRPVRFLREFSNYLTPRLGSFSFDTWTMVAIYTRNLVLNQATLICFLGAVLLIPQFLIYPLYSRLGDDFRKILEMIPKILQWGDNWIWAFAVVLVVLAVYFMSVNIHATFKTRSDEAGSNVGPDSGGDNPWTRSHVQLSVIAPFLTAMYLGSMWIWRHERFLLDHERTVFKFGFGIACFLSFLLLLNGGFFHEFRQRQVGRIWIWLLPALIVALCAGAMSGLLLVDLDVMRILRQLGDEGAWLAEIFAPLILLAVLVVPGTLQVGLMGVDLPDAGREWLSRFRAICTVYSIWWVALLGGAIYGPWLILTAWNHGSAWISSLGTGWIVTTLGGIVAGKSSKTGSDSSGPPKVTWLQLLARIGPPVFVMGLVLLLATFEKVLLAHGQNPSFSTDPSKAEYWRVPDLPYPLSLAAWWPVYRLEGLFAMLVVGGALLAWRVDINEFSMHHFYKNRLVRCYLGASNEKRRPDEFTGFDASDDLRLSRLKTIHDKDESEIKETWQIPFLTKKPRQREDGDHPYLGPYPILNTTLNLSTGEQLAWQERKGASFILSPCFCGFDLLGWASSTAAKKKNSRGKSERSESLLPAAYRKTSGFTHKDGPFLGTSFSISGAAANPNQGYNTSPAVAFLMTMFDVRLGWWLGNPRRGDEWKQSSPTFGLVALLRELVGMTNDREKFVNLSDGGHFDNMGIYELVRRRCSLIMLCDAEEDPEFKFEGLGSAIRKCRIDFGASIEIDTSLIRPGKDGKPSSAHCAVGTIRYLDGSLGTLVYIKPSLTGDEPEDLEQYHEAHADFPHESTADQWFSESQFESYRALGYHATDQSLTPAGAWINWKSEQPDVPGLIEALTNYWYPDNPNLKQNASQHTATLVRLLDSIRSTDDLRDLGSRLFPGITVPPPGNSAATQKFYFGLAVLQLVEDIYFDFKLDRPAWANDPRIGGWTHLFKTWKRVPEVAAAWTSERQTFRKDFQIFWDRL